MWTGYLELAAQEAVNSVRAQRYAADAGLVLACENCPDLAAAVGDAPYYTLHDDPAPWVDAARPESYNFLGVFGLGVAGFTSVPMERTITQLMTDGAIVGPKRMNHREIAFTVMLIAKDRIALDYGLQWLTFVLDGASDCGQCTGDQLCMFASCPGTYPSALPAGDAEIRHLYNVTVIDPPTLVEADGNPQRWAGGILLANVTFTLAADPWIYQDPIALADQDPATDGWIRIAAGQKVNGLDPDEIVALCQDPPSCLDDRDCPEPVLPPAPPQVIDPCYPQGATDWWRTVVRVAPQEQPKSLESVPVIEVTTGSRELRRLIVRFWLNPQGVDCTDVTRDPCRACLDVTVAYLPAKSSLTIDGRTRTARVECPDAITGLSSFDTPQLYGMSGSAFEWPDFKCPVGLCIEVLTPRDSVADDAQIRVDLVPRAKVG